MRLPNFASEGRSLTVLTSAMVAIFVWSIAPVTAAIFYSKTTWFPLTFWTLFFGWISISFYSIFKATIDPEIDLTERLKNCPKNVWILTALAGTFTGAYNLCFYMALETGPRIPVVIVNYLWPIFLILFISLFRRSGLPSPREWFWIFLAFLGAFWSSFHSRLLPHLLWTDWAV